MLLQILHKFLDTFGYLKKKCIQVGFKKTGTDSLLHIFSQNKSKWIHLWTIHFLQTCFVQIEQEKSFV